MRSVAEIFAAADRAGELAAWFAASASLSAAERRRIQTEEAWTLGVTAPRRAPRTAGVSPANAAAIASTRRPATYAYLRDPAAIYRRSFALIRSEASLDRFPASLRPLALRLAHTAGDAAILDDLAWSRGAATIGSRALSRGAAILVDSDMVAAGIVRDRLPVQNPVTCTLRDPRTPAIAAQQHTTRSAAAVELWRPDLAGAVVAIGNAPTALFRLLEMLAAGADRPAVILGFPVGFVGAAEAKAALIDFGGNLPFIALRGRRGGSALAAAAVNALGRAQRAISPHSEPA